MRRISILAVLFSLVTPMYAGAQEGSYDIKHYELTIQPYFETKAISVNTTISISNRNLSNEFNFGLNDNYSSVNVKCDVSPVTVERGSGSITIFVEKPASDLQLTFEMWGVLGKSNDENRDVIADSSLFLLWSDRFYPIDFDDWATVRTRIVLPARFLAIAPGKLTDTRKSKEEIEYVFDTTTPAACFSVLADSRWIKTERKVRFLRMQTLLYPQSQRFAKQIFETSYDVISAYSQTYCLYPFDQFTFVTVSGINARRAFPGFVGYSPEYLEKELTSTGGDAHETALLWWDYTTRGKGPGAFQWTEGFGDYAEFLYDEDSGRPIPKIFETFKEEYLSLPVEQDVLYYDLTGSTPQEIIHGKYPWLMRVLRYVVGEPAYKNAMGLLFYKFRFRTFSMDEFVSTLEEGGGQPVGWWKEEWLERKGVPIVSLKYEATRKDSGYQITVFLKQLGEIYHFPLELGIRTSKGMRVDKVNLSIREMTFTFKSAEEPQSVVIDPNDWLLMRKIYEK